MTVMLIFYSDGSSDSGPSYQLPNKIETKTSDSHAIMVYSPIVSITSKQFVSKKTLVEISKNVKMTLFKVFVEHFKILLANKIWVQGANHFQKFCYVLSLGCLLSSFVLFDW